MFLQKKEKKKSEREREKERNAHKTHWRNKTEATQKRYREERVRRRRRDGSIGEGELEEMWVAKKEAPEPTPHRLVMLVRLEFLRCC